MTDYLWQLSKASSHTEILDALLIKEPLHLQKEVILPKESLCIIRLPISTHVDEEDINLLREYLQSGTSLSINIFPVSFVTSFMIRVEITKDHSEKDFCLNCYQISEQSIQGECILFFSAATTSYPEFSSPSCLQVCSDTFSGKYYPASAHPRYKVEGSPAQARQEIRQEQTKRKTESAFFDFDL